MDSCYVFLQSNVAPLSSKQLDAVFDRKNDLEMVQTMQSIFQQQCNGEDVEPYIIPIIKNVSTSASKQLKRILHMFWPNVDCYYANGNLKPHMILICNSILQDLQYCNEFIVCSALRCVMNFQVKEVVQHLVQAIPPLLKNESDEIRATAAIAVRVMNTKFTGIVSTRILQDQFILEKQPAVVRHMIVALATIDQQFFSENISTVLEKFNYMTDQYEVGMALFDSFEKLTPGLQNQLISKLKIFDQYAAQIYYQAGRALIRMYQHNQEYQQMIILAAQCLLQSCKESSQSSILQIIEIISKLELQNIQNSSHVAQTLAQVFTSSQQSEEVQYKLFKTCLFQKICVHDSKSSKQIVDSLTSSRIIETTNIDLYYQLLNTVYEVALASNGFAEINIAGVQELCKVCISSVEYTSANQQLVPRVYGESCQTALNILKEVGNASPQDKKLELMKILLKVIFQCYVEDVYKQALWILGELIQKLDQQNQLHFSTAFLLLLDIPNQFELTQNDETKEFLQNNVVPLLFSTKDDNDDDERQIPLYIFVKQGKHSFLTSVLTSVGRKLCYSFDSRSFIVQRVLLGLAHVVKKTQFLTSDQQIAYQNMQDIYVYASENIKVANAQSTANKQITQQTHQKSTAKTIDGALFSLFGTQAQVQSQKPNTEQNKKKLNPYQMLGQNPNLIHSIHQLSADADMIYAEALVVTNKTQILLSVLFVNRTANNVESLELELFTSNALKAYQQQKKITLDANSSVVQTYELSITSCSAATIYGNICVRFSTPKLKERHKDVIMRIKEIQFEIKEFVKQYKLTLNELRRLWSSCEFEFRVAMNNNVVGVEQFTQIVEKIHFSQCMIQQVDELGQGLYSAQSLTGEEILVVFSCAETGSVKVRSQNKELCEGICQYIGEQ